MATVTWNKVNGNWFVAANWDVPPAPVTHRLPGAGDDVAIPNNGTPGAAYTVSYNGTATVNTLAGSDDGILDIVGGSLTLTNGGATNQMGIHLAAGSTLNVSAGLLQLTSGDFAGTLGGAGEILLRGGTFNLNAGVAVNVASLVLGLSSNGTASTTNLNTNLTISTSFTLADLSGNHAVLNLNNRILTLAAEANIDGTVVGPGQLRITGDAVQGSSGFGAPIVTGGAILDYRTGSTGLQHLTTHLGDATTDGKLIVRSGAVYTIDASVAIASVSTAHAFVVNDGTLRAVGGGVNASIEANLKSTGAIVVGNGASLALIGGATNQLSGELKGAGRLVVGSGSTTISSASVTVGELQMNGGNGGAALHLGSNLTYGGKFSFANQFDTLFLHGHTFLLTGTGNTMFNNIVEGANGRVRVTGDLTVGGNVNLGGTTDIVVENAGSVFQNGNITLSGTLTNIAGHTWEISSASNIFNGGATINNNGVFFDSAAGLSVVSGAFTNTGRIAVASGAQLSLGDGTQTIGGIVSGGGTLTFGFGANAEFAPTNVSIASITLQGGNGGATLRLGADIVYGGRMAFAGSFDTLQLNSHSLTLSGQANSFLGNTISGVGTVRVTGTASIGGNLSLGVATFANAGTMNQVGGLLLDGLLHNEAGALYRVTSAGTVQAGANASIVNDGTILVKGAGTTQILAPFDNNGALTIGTGAELRLSGGATLDGTISGPGTLAFGGGTTAINTAIGTGGLNIAGNTTLNVDLTYGGAFSFTNGFAVLDLNGHTLDLSGPASFVGGTIAGDLALTDEFLVTGSTINIAALAFSGWTAGQDLILLRGTSGADQLTGGGQADSLVGGGGNDTLNGGGGADTLAGGGGNDTYVGVSAADAINESAGTQAGSHDAIQVATDFSLAAYPNIEDLILTGAADLDGDGNAAANVITGNTGNNVLNGLDGKDTLNGGVGADTLNGGNGNDVLIGGTGNDRMNGGADADTFRFATANTGTDTIAGFNTADDRFDLAGGTFSAISDNGVNTRLTHAGGTLIMQGVTGLSLSQWNALVLPAGGSAAAQPEYAFAPDAADLAVATHPVLSSVGHADFLGG